MPISAAAKGPGHLLACLAPLPRRAAGRGRRTGQGTGGASDTPSRRRLRARALGAGTRTGITIAELRWQLVDETPKGALGGDPGVSSMGEPSSRPWPGSEARPEPSKPCSSANPSSECRRKRGPSDAAASEDSDPRMGNNSTMRGGDSGGGALSSRTTTTPSLETTGEPPSRPPRRWGG